MTAPRRSPRKVAEKILPIDMQPNNHAIVLNFSEGGLAFRALNPVTQLGTIHFSFVENGERVQASGELVWTDPTQQMGGLRFASMPASSLERLKYWAAQSAGGEINANRTPRGSALSGMGSQSATALPRPYAAPGEAQWSQAPTPSFALMGDDAEYSRYASEMSLPNSRGKFSSGFLTGMIVTVILAAGLLYFSGNSLEAWVSQGRSALGLPPSAQTAPPPVPPAAVSQPAPAAPALPSAPNSVAPAAPAPLPSPAAEEKTNIPPAQNALAPPVVPGPPTNAPVAPSDAAVDSGQTDLALAQHYLNDRGGNAYHAAAVAPLWAAIQKGNVTAEITLADLYARGDGVTKNCNQARVLLRAAAERGNKEASDRLAQVVRSGCR